MSLHLSKCSSRAQMKNRILFDFTWQLGYVSLYSNFSKLSHMESGNYLRQRCALTEHVNSKYHNLRCENVSVVDKITLVPNTMLYLWENAIIITVLVPMNWKHKSSKNVETLELEDCKKCGSIRTMSGRPLE